MGQHRMGQYRPQRTVSLYVAEYRLKEGGLLSFKLTNYPQGEVGAVYPMLAWDGLWEGPELPILMSEIQTTYQALAALHMEQQG